MVEALLSREASFGLVSKEIGNAVDELWWDNVRVEQCRDVAGSDLS